MLVTREYIQELLMRDSQVGMHSVGRALLVLLKNQTDLEKRIAQTKIQNGEGFTQADAKRGTSMANFYKTRGFLTPKQVAYWRKTNIRGVPRISKYWRQLLEASNNRTGE